MRKIILGLAFLFLLITVQPTNVMAQGQFSCFWDPTYLTCDATTEYVANGCVGGWVVDQAVCDPGNDKYSDCAAIEGPHECIGGNCEEAEGSGYVFDMLGGCTCTTRDPEFETIEDCVAARNDTGIFKCNTTTGVCSLCTQQQLLGDVDCDLNMVQCFDECKPTVIIETTIPTCTTSGGDDGVWTALGCIAFGTNSAAAFIVSFGIGLGGGIALIAIAFSAFIVMTSGGDPKKLSMGKELFFSSLIGLLLILLSTYLLRIIGVDVLGLF